ncbi:hypothetical protein DMENIID0001_105140 [Sergentomyia squamirostris]
MSQNCEIFYKKVDTSNLEVVKKFLLEHYYPHEPLTQGSVYKGPLPEDIAFTLDCLQEDTSIGAFDNSGEMLGVLLSAEFSDTDSEWYEEEFQKDISQSWRELLHFYKFIDDTMNLFETMGVSSSCYIYAVAVAESARGRGVATELVRRACDVARMEDYPLISIDCSNIYTSRVAERLGMTFLNSFRIADYRNTSGQRMFNPLEPHGEFKSFAKKLKD